MTAGHLPDHPATSRSAPLLLPRAAGTGATDGERRSRWSRRPSSTARSSCPVARASASAKHGRTAPASRRSCSGATGCKTVSGPAALAWCGARTTSSCTATSRSSGSALAPDEDPERVTREALASARLAHPAIVALYEACPVADAFYLISELVDGDTLARLIAEDALSDDEILRIGEALCSALAHAHARGVDPSRRQAAERARPARRRRQRAPARSRRPRRRRQADGLRRCQAERRGRAHAYGRRDSARSRTWPRSRARVVKPASRWTCTRWRSCSMRHCAASIRFAARRRRRPRGASGGRSRARARASRPPAGADADARPLPASRPNSRATLQELAGALDDALEQDSRGGRPGDRPTQAQARFPSP